MAVMLRGFVGLAILHMIALVAAFLAGLMAAGAPGTGRGGLHLVLGWTATFSFLAVQASVWVVFRSSRVAIREIGQGAGLSGRLDARLRRNWGRVLPLMCGGFLASVGTAGLGVAGQSWGPAGSLGHLGLASAAIGYHGVTLVVEAVAIRGQESLRRAAIGGAASLEDRPSADSGLEDHQARELQ